MGKFIERLSELRDERRARSIPVLLKNVADPQRDKKGTFTRSLLSTYKFLAISDYVLEKNVNAFKSQLAQAANIRKNLFERFEKGEPIAKSFLSMLCYKDVFNALAAGDIELAKTIASYMERMDRIEKIRVHPFDYAFGHTVSAFVLDNRPEMEKWSEEFSKICQKKDNANFRGYAIVFEGVLRNDIAKVATGFELLIEGHKRMSKGRGIFKDTEDELICVWGLGLANFVKLRGMAIEITDPLIPKDLLI